jgi:hypothetical protein
MRELEKGPDTEQRGRIHFLITFEKCIRPLFLWPLPASCLTRLELQGCYAALSLYIARRYYRRVFWSRSALQARICSGVDLFAGEPAPARLFFGKGVRACRALF